MQYCFLKSHVCTQSVVHRWSTALKDEELLCRVKTRMGHLQRGRLGLLLNIYTFKL